MQIGSSRPMAKSPPATVVMSSASTKPIMLGRIFIIVSANAALSGSALFALTAAARS
jgi:hypothetical protein